MPLGVCLVIGCVSCPWVHARSLGVCLVIGCSSSHGLHYINSPWRALSWSLGACLFIGCVSCSWVLAWSLGVCLVIGGRLSCHERHYKNSPWQALAWSLGVCLVIPACSAGDVSGIGIVRPYLLSRAENGGSTRVAPRRRIVVSSVRRECLQTKQGANVICFDLLSGATPHAKLAQAPPGGPATPPAHRSLP